MKRVFSFLLTLCLLLTALLSGAALAYFAGLLVYNLLSQTSGASMISV